MDTEHGPQEQQEEYSFIQEKIKEEEFNPRKLMTKVCGLLLFGLVFGCAACVAFFALKPWAEEAFQKEPNKVELGSEDDEEQADSPNDEEQEQQEVIEVQKELTIDDYQVLYNALGEVTSAARKSVVTISGIAESDDWASGQQTLQGNTAGVIVADNGRELLILGKYSSVKNTQLFQVEFIDGTKHQATLKQKDVNLDMAVFSVAKDGISDATWDGLSIAQLGNSARLKQGMPLIAVGQPFGYKDGIGYGVVSSVKESVTLADGAYEVFVTDMVLDSDGSGILVDISGNVMGIIDGNLAKSQGASTMMAYAISAIKNEIEMMSNGKHVPYAGIVGVMVTEEVSELRGIPKGLYVKEVEKDSPAMKAGIQSGDVITSVADTDITSLNIYHNALYKLEAGQTVKFKGQRFGTEEYVDVNFTVTIGIKE